MEERLSSCREQNKQRQEAGELEPTREMVDVPQGQQWVVRKDRMSGTSEVAQQGLGRAIDRETLNSTLYRTTGIPYSEAFTQILRLPGRKKISAWRQSGLGVTIPTV